MTKRTLLHDLNTVNRKVNGKVAVITGNTFTLYSIAHSCKELKSLPNGVEFDTSEYVLVTYPSSRSFPHGWTGIVRAAEKDRVTYLVNKYWKEQQLDILLKQKLVSL